MPQARILVNAVLGSNDNVPINVLVQLDNQSLGDETSYTWAILDQPPGTTDVLSSTTIKNPTFTPKKEGSYLLKLTVDLGLATEQSNTVIVAVRQMKTTERIPAAGETTEDDTSDGWAAAMNSLLRRIDSLLSDPGVLVGAAGAGGLAKGSLLKTQAGLVIKSGLPGQETVPLFTLAPATSLTNVDELLVMMEGAVVGGGTPTLNELCKARYLGRFANVQVNGGAGGAAGDPIYVDDTGRPSLTQGTIRRQIGSILANLTGGYYDLWFNGVGGEDITPIDAKYLLWGAPAAGMTNAKRLDGTSADACPAGKPWTFKPGDAATAAMMAVAYATGSADIAEFMTSAYGLLTSIDHDGNLVFNIASQRVRWPSWRLGENAIDTFNLGTATKPTSFQFHVYAGGAGLNITAPAGLVQTALFANDSSGLDFGTNSAHPLTVFINGSARWRFENGGTYDLTAQADAYGIGWTNYRISQGTSGLEVAFKGGNRIAGFSKLISSSIFKLFGYDGSDPANGYLTLISVSGGNCDVNTGGVTAPTLGVGAGGVDAFTISPTTQDITINNKRVINVADPVDPTSVNYDRDVPSIRMLGKFRPIRERFGSGIAVSPWSSPYPIWPGDAAWSAGSNHVYDPGTISGVTDASTGSTTGTYSMGAPFYLPEAGRLLFSYHVVSEATDQLKVYLDGALVATIAGYSPRRGGLFVSAPLRAGLHSVAFRFNIAGTAHSPSICAVTDVSALTEGELRAQARGVEVFDENWMLFASTSDLNPAWSVIDTGGGSHAATHGGLLIMEPALSSGSEINANGPVCAPAIHGGTYSTTGFIVMEALGVKFDLSGHGALGDYEGQFGYLGRVGTAKGAWLYFHETAALSKSYLSIGTSYASRTDYEIAWNDYANPHTYTIGANAAGVHVNIDGVANLDNQSVAWDTEETLASNDPGYPKFRVKTTTAGTSIPFAWVGPTEVLSGLTYPTP